MINWDSNPSINQKDATIYECVPSDHNYHQYMSQQRTMMLVVSVTIIVTMIVTIMVMMTVEHPHQRQKMN